MGKMIAAHFEQRKLDEEELSNLSDRIEKRKKVREEQTIARAAREKERAEREKVEKARREEEERKKTMPKRRQPLLQCLSWVAPRTDHKDNDAVVIKKRKRRSWLSAENNLMLIT